MVLAGCRLTFTKVVLGKGNHHRTAGNEQSLQKGAHATRFRWHLNGLLQQQKVEPVVVGKSQMLANFAVELASVGWCALGVYAVFFHFATNSTHFLGKSATKLQECIVFAVQTEGNAVVVQLQRATCFENSRQKPLGATRLEVAQTFEYFVFDRLRKSHGKILPRN